MVTISMRKEAARIKKQNERLQQTKEKRNLAIQLLQSGKSIRATVALTGLSKGTVGRLSQGLNKARREGTSYDDSQKNLIRGRKRVLSDDEELLVKARLEQMADDNFEITYETVKSVVADIANDGRKGFVKGVPSDDWIRMFRVRHPDCKFGKCNR